jgi:hypothetical protein
MPNSGNPHETPAILAGLSRPDGAAGLLSAGMNDNATVGQLESSKRLYLFRLFCAVVWAGELFGIQAMAFETVPWLKYPVFTQLLRLWLDFIFATTLLFLLPRRFLILLQALNALVMTVLGVYAINFHWPLMPVRVLSEWREAWSLHSQIHELVPLWLVGVIVFSFSGQGFFTPEIRAQHAVMAGAVAVAGCRSVDLQPAGGRAANDTPHEAEHWPPTAGPGRAVYAYGYMVPWLCDLLSNRSLTEQAARAKAYLTHNYDRLAPVGKAPARTGPHCRAAT